MNCKSGSEEDLESEIRQQEQEIEKLKEAVDEADYNPSIKHDKLIDAQDEIDRLNEKIASLKFEGTSVGD